MPNYQSKIALLASSIDYAGMFPPASLSLNETLQNYFSFRKKGTHPYLLKRLVLGIEEVKKLNPSLLFENGSDGSPVDITVLGRQHTSSSYQDFVKTIDWDLREMRRIQERYEHSSALVRLVGYETKLPSKISDPGEGITSGEYIFPALEQMEQIWTGKMEAYFEVGFEGAWKETTTAVAQILREWGIECEGSLAQPGLKIRTGGQYTPTPEQLAWVISECAKNETKIKTTQGLHHPITHENEFGFINFFAAVAFAFVLSEEAFNFSQLVDCLSEKQKEAFSFKKEVFSWKDISLSLEQIETARSMHQACFGSCSLNEPDQFLLKEFP